MTEKEYRQHPAISRSELWHIRESPEKFKYFKEHPPESTPALLFGQVFHKLALQPETFDDEFVVAQSFDRRTKSGKADYEAFALANANKVFVSSEIYQQAMAMCEMLYKNPLARKLLSGEREKDFFWTDELTGEECKCRVDCLTQIGDTCIVVDIKTASSAETEAFMKSAINHGYDFQSGMYGEGVKACTGRDINFVFIAIEKDPPYAINILQADKLFIQRGHDLYRELIGIYHECKTTDNWYGYLGRSNIINNLNLPIWLVKENE